MTKDKKRPNPSKYLVINAFDMGCIGLQNPGLWAHPDDKKSTGYKNLNYWTDLAKTLEKGKFNGVFLADVLGGYDVYNGPENIGPAAKAAAQWPVNEPSAVVSAMAAVTKHLSFGVTFSTISEHPYHFARRIATLDHLTDGRVGWNIVSTYLDSAARNLLENQPLPEHDERYVRTEEYFDVVAKLLLASWADDAVKNDKVSRIYADPSRIRKINHKGKYFEVPGPQITEPSPQRLPVVLQAGTSNKGKEFAARCAEVVFITTFTPEKLASEICDIKTRALKYGRKQGDIKFLQLVTVVLGESSNAAAEKYRELQSKGDLEGAQALFSGWTGIDIGKFGADEELRDVGSNAVKGFVNNWTKVSPGEPKDLRKTRAYVAKNITVGGLGPVFYGTTQFVADEIERWVNVSEVDGFNFTYAVSPGSFEDIVEYLIPELQRRGLVWEDYPKSVHGTLSFREGLFGPSTEGADSRFLKPSHPAYKYRWTSGVSKKSFEGSITQD